LNADGSFTYTPNANYCGPDSFTYKANDGTADSNIATVSIDVTCVNDHLMAVDDFNTTTIGACIDINVTINDYDPENDTLLLTELTDPNFGNVSIIDTRGLIRICPENQCGTMEFNYTVTDGDAYDTAKVTITVPCPQVTTNDDFNSTVDRFTCVEFNITDNDDGSGYKVQVVSGSVTTPNFGNVTVLDPNGTIRFCPQGSCGTVTFDYNASNGYSYDRGTVTITVPCPQPECPVAVGDYNTTTMNNCITLNLMNNDYDPNGDPIQVTGIKDSPHGIIEFLDFRNGIIRYCPDANFCGTDFFEYTITDGQCDSTGTVRIDVICEAPKEKVPAALLYPLVDIERLTLTQGPIPIDGSIGTILDTGTNIIIDGKVIAVLEVTPGTKSLIAQVDNLGFVTQNDVGIRFEDLPKGVSVKFEPKYQKIKAHGIGTYMVTLTVSDSVPKGTYSVTAKAFTRQGVLDVEVFRLVVN